MNIISRANYILENSKLYRKLELVECIDSLLRVIESIGSKPEVVLASEPTVHKSTRQEIVNPEFTLDALRKTPIVLLTEKYEGGQFSGIDQYQYKYNGLVYTFALEGTYIIEAYTENEIN